MKTLHYDIWQVKIIGQTLTGQEQWKMYIFLEQKEINLPVEFSEFCLI